jgi:N-acetylmuramoyl-L-alanine amidase
MRIRPNRRHPMKGWFVVLAALFCSWDCAWAQPAAAPSGQDRAACDRGAFRVVLDVGHSDQVPGAKSARGLREYDYNLRLAKLVDRQLIAAGFANTKLLITDGAKMKSLHQRVARANSASADLFLSIHHDSVPDSFLQNWEFQGEPRKFSDRFKGHSIWVSRDNRDYSGSLLFGKLLGNELKTRGLSYTTHYTEKFMGRHRWPLVDSEAGVYRHDALIVLKDTRMPAVLLEAGSIINRDEELAMQSSERQSLVAAAVTKAVDEFCAARGPNSPQRVAGERGNALVHHTKQR